MGFEKNHICGKVEVDIRSSVVGAIVFETETPGQALVSRFSMPIPVTTGRTVLRSRLPGTMQGHFVKATGTPGTTGHWELYGVRLWVRELPTGQWGWFPLPVMETPIEYLKLTILEDPTAGGAAAEVGFAEFKLPVEPTPELHIELKMPAEPTPVEYAELKMPVEPTGESFNEVKPPVEGTPESFSEFQVPVEQSAATYTPAPMPVDATPVEFSAIKLPLPPTPEEYAMFTFPVKPTPPVPEWRSVPVDE